jgi:hypothetical protein
LIEIYNILYNKGKGYRFYERGKRYTQVFLDGLSDFDVLWATKEGTNGSVE